MVKNKILREYALLYSYILIVTVVFVVKFALEKRVPGYNYIPLLLMVVMAFFSTPRLIFCCLAFISPLYVVSNINLIMIVAAIALLFKMKVNKYFVPTVIIILIETINLFIGKFVILEYLGITSLLLIMSYFVFGVNKKDGLENSNYSNALIYSFISGYFLMGFLTLNATLKLVSLSEMFRRGIRFGYTNTINNNVVLHNTTHSFDIPTNVLGIYSILTITLLLVLSRKSKKKYINFLLILFPLFCGTMTLSQTFVITICIVAIIFLLYTLKGKKPIIPIISFVIILFIIHYVLNNVYPELLKAIADRFERSDMTSGRATMVWPMYLGIIFGNFSVLLHGIGLTDYMDKIASMVSDLNNVPPPHSIILESLVLWGLSGLIFEITFVILMLKQKAKKLNYKYDGLYYLPLIAVGIVFLGEQYFSYFSAYGLIIIPAFCALKLDSPSMENDDIVVSKI